MLGGNKDRGKPARKGYTIVEVMLFLAVSGFMFLIAATFVSGKQASSEFRQGMNDINSNIRQVINDVANGFFPANANFNCYTDSAGPHITSGSAGQGTNSGNRTSQGISGGGCVYLGKAIIFSNGGNATKYGVYTVAGNQYANGAVSGDAPKSYAEAMPAGIPSLTDVKTLQWGLTNTGVYACSGVNCATRQNLTAVYFYGSLGQYTGATLQSGSQTVAVLATTASATLTNPSVLMCFQGGANQFGSIFLNSGAGQGLHTNMQIGSSKTQGCP